MKGNLKQVASRVTLFLRDLPSTSASIDVWKQVSQEFQDGYEKHYVNATDEAALATKPEADNWLGTVKKVDQYVYAILAARQIRDELQEHIEDNHLVY